MEGLHHGLEFGQLTAAIARAGITGVWTEEIRGVIAPIIREFLFRKMLVGEERMDRHQFDGGDAEPLQVLNRRFGGKARISPRSASGISGCRLVKPLTCNSEMMESLSGRQSGPVLSPIEVRIRHHALLHPGSVVVFIKREVGVAVAWLIRKNRRGPILLAGQQL